LQIVSVLPGPTETIVIGTFTYSSTKAK